MLVIPCSFNNWIHHSLTLSLLHLVQIKDLENYNNLGHIMTNSQVLIEGATG